jgi:hypothetical protein
MSASSSFIAKNRAGILGVSRLAQTIFLMACSADPWRTADSLRFGTSPVSGQTNEALRPIDGNPEVIGWSVGLVLTNALLATRINGEVTIFATATGGRFYGEKQTQEGSKNDPEIA